MPSIMTHAAIPLALWCAADRGRIPPRLLVAGVVAAMLPDADVLAFALHIPYADAFGHRGASHSLLFACMLAALAAVLAFFAGRHPRLAPTVQAAVFVFICAASHPLLDAMTSGGLGVALAWPWSEQRFFAPWRPIRVSPFAAQFFSARGLATLLSELRWVWLPLAGAVVAWKLIQPAPVAPRDPS
ncbi:TPA: metal-dependent hydrolase [Stenotrophomonas maltophilia]|nr:metal-dependent hydrolase [Stenotrophomonas maltophilia]HDS1027143.1 metal-dependent hydrolase [Stenotrophomonas maltophilia]HDS1029076.1 metal-dependent hydrolase [Stenotrophomonas maltophilia]HDS1036018.1 metal-dependent hydrolase [Stenotrophomonas maltophilia]HDS1037226.1 metal-dependent hydrolase [Stenotrophomonas maltophilia]